MLRTFLRCTALVGLVGIGACDMNVENPNSPDTRRVLASPKDVEGLLGGYFKRWHIAHYGNSLSNVRGMMLVQSFENSSSLANNCMNQRGPIPRPANDNSIGNGCAIEQNRVYQIHSEVNRVASNVLDALDVPGFSLGSPAQDIRAKAFGEFLRGISLGYLSLLYDSAGVVAQGMTTEDPGELMGYMQVMDSALAALTRAIGHASAANASASGGFPLPGDWIPGQALTSANFIRLARSYKARLRANVARTPDERAAANWTEIIGDAQNGITANFNITTASVGGPFNQWVTTVLGYGTWHQMAPFVIGMADNSGAYANYIATPLADRGSTGAFFMTTPDLRFPQGATRAAQQADFALTMCNTAGTVCPRYFVNRVTGGDSFSAAGWAWSNYDFARFYTWRTAGSVGGATANNGPFPFMTLAEMRMLEAEGHIRAGNHAAARALINVTRTQWGLPDLIATDMTTPVPGGADCVPKVPVAPFNVVACGNIMEAMKWEKRMETAYTHFGAWFFDGRGWGDLVRDTPLHWAPPYGDLQARGRPTSAIYSTGGPNGLASAALGTYGW